MPEKDTNDRWAEYFEDLLNGEFPNEQKIPTKPITGPTQIVTTEQVTRKSCIRKIIRLQDPIVYDQKYRKNSVEWIVYWKVKECQIPGG